MARESVFRRELDETEAALGDENLGYAQHLAELQLGVEEAERKRARNAAGPETGKHMVFVGIGVMCEVCGIVYLRGMQR